MIAAPVATLNVTVRTSRMPHGSEFKRITKAIEHLYYLTLFSSVPDYARRGDAWQSWLDAGTDLAVREAPKAVAREDRYVDIRTEDEVRVLHDLTGWALAGGYQLAGLSVLRVSLEDVYLGLTRAEEPDSGEGVAAR